MDFLTIFQQPNSLAVDITTQCNLSCRHCYYHRYDHADVRELTEEQWRERIAELTARHHFLHATLLGGEPLLRPEVVETISKLVRYNLVYTNGSLPIPRLPRCVVAVTIDSVANREAINGLSLDITADMISSTNTRTIAAMTVTGANRSEVAEVMEHCTRLDVSGMIFNFYVPMKGDTGEARMCLAERDEAIADILALKQEYPGFVLNSDVMLKLTTSEFAPAIVADCPIKRNVICLDAGGERKRPCTFGPKADCSLCGAQAAFMHHAAFGRFDAETFHRFMWGVTHGSGLLDRSR